MFYPRPGDQINGTPYEKSVEDLIPYSTPTTSALSTTAVFKKPVVKPTVHPPSRKSTAIDINEVFMLPKGTTLIYLQDSDNLANYSSLCHTPQDILLNIQFISKVSANTFMKSFSKISCHLNIKGLEISGPISKVDLHKLSSNFSHIHYLILNGDYLCSSLSKEENFQYFQDAQSNLEPVTLHELTLLQIKNIQRECSGTAEFLNQFTDLRRVSTLVFDNINIFIQVEDSYRMLLSKPNSITYLMFQPSGISPNGNLIDRTNSKSFKDVKGLKFNCSSLGNECYSVFHNIVENGVPNLQYLEYSGYIPRGEDLTVFQGLTGARVLDLTLIDIHLNGTVLSMKSLLNKYYLQTV